LLRSLRDPVAHPASGDDLVTDALPTTASPETLASALRRTLRAAQANLEIRERVRALLDDPNRLAHLVRQLGPTHAVLRDLRALVHHGEPEVPEEVAT
jgi:hypothetical protein